MKFLVAVSTIIVAIAAAQTNTSASVTPATNSSSVPSSSKAPAVSPSLESSTPVPGDSATPVAATAVPGDSLTPVVVESLSPFIPPVTLPPYATDAPVVMEPTTEAPSMSPNTAAPANKPPNPGEPSCNVCGGSFVMKMPDEQVSSGLFGDVSCNYVNELGQGGYLTADQCNATVSIVTKPCQCEDPETEAPVANATVTITPDTTSTNAPVTKAPKSSGSVMIGIDGAIVAAAFILNAVLN